MRAAKPAHTVMSILVRFTFDDESVPPGDGSHLRDGCLVVVSDVTPSQTEAAFTRPEVAVETIRGLRSGRALIDRTGLFRTIQNRANAFQWDEEMQSKANQWASGQLVGWIEEVYKGLAGLSSGDTGRLLHVLRLFLGTDTRPLRPEGCSPQRRQRPV